VLGAVEEARAAAVVFATHDPEAAAGYARQSFISGRMPQMVQTDSQCEKVPHFRCVAFPGIVYTLLVVAVFGTAARQIRECGSM
jgi:hypothetical protein